jgi:nucleotide-binding universal stress UspA family protein
LDRARPERLMSYLKRNGLTQARFVRLEGANISQALIEGARREGCDVLAAGAYGRPRLYELALGGTTQALVKAQTPPHILLVH